MNKKRFNFKLSPWLKGLLGLVLVVFLWVALSTYWNLRTASQPQVPVSQQVFSTPTITTDQIDPTVGWKVYTDPVYQYTVKYPSNWNVSRQMDGPGKDRRVDFISRLPLEPGEDPPTSISITVYDNLSGLPIETWIESQLLQGVAVDVQKGLHREQIEIDGVTGERIIGLPSRFGTLDVFVSSGQYVYRFTLTPYDLKKSVLTELSLESAQLFDQMLETFDTN